MRFLFLSACLIMTTPAVAQQFSLLDSNQPAKKEVHIHNRVLAVVNGTPISLLDVVKQMDVFFVKQYPQYANNPEAKHQFYSVNWKHFLEEKVNKQLILADVEEIGLKISKGDIRQEMEGMFGPNVIGTLDEAGISMDEAWEILETDIAMRRMMMIRVNQKAIKSVTPQKIREAYEILIDEHVPDAEWTYQVITIRDEDQAHAKDAAESLHRQLVNGEINIKDIPSSIDGAKISVSKEYIHNSEEISKDYQSVIETVNEGTFSDPVEQTTRRSEVVQRIFFVKEANIGDTPTFDKIHVELKNKLVNEAVDQLTEEYMAKLRKQYPIEEKHLANESYEPFTLQGASR